MHGGSEVFVYSKEKNKKQKNNPSSENYIIIDEEDEKKEEEKKEENEDGGEIELDFSLPIDIESKYDNETIVKKNKKRKRAPKLILEDFDSEYESELSDRETYEDDDEEEYKYNYNYNNDKKEKNQLEEREEEKDENTEEDVESDEEDKILNVIPLKKRQADDVWEILIRSSSSEESDESIDNYLREGYRIKEKSSIKNGLYQIIWKDSWIKESDIRIDKSIFNNLEDVSIY